MNSKENIINNLGRLKEEDVKAVQSIIFDLKQFSESRKLTEDSILMLANALTGLTSLKEMITWRLIRLLKQDHMLD